MMKRELQMKVIKKGETPASTTDYTTKLAAIQIVATANMYIRPNTHLYTSLDISLRIAISWD